MEIKKVWVSESHINGLYNLCFRFANHLPTKRMVMSQTELPPIPEVKGTSRLGLKDAQDRGLSEDHVVLSTFDEQDLVRLYNAIGEFLGTDP